MQSGETIEGRFAIERLAGTGGMGHVYLARDLATREPCAIKVLRAEGEVESARFAREAQLLSELRHPRIVRYVAHGTTPEGEPYLVTEWLEGEDLSRRLSRQPLSIGETLKIVHGIAEALGAAHRRGVIHRDVKPSNVFLVEGRSDRVKVLDFGVARVGMKSASMRSITQTGALVGTPGYMAPEQARGEKEVDARADVFALGCVLFRCLTGKAPFGSSDLLSVLLKLAVDEVPSVREALGPGVMQLPDALEDLVTRMLQKHPVDRPTDGDAVAEELAQIELASPVLDPSSNEALRTLGPGERRVTCAVLVVWPVGLDREPTTTGAGDDAPTQTETDPATSPTAPSSATNDSRAERAERVIVEGLLQEHGAATEPLGVGSLLAHTPERGTFSDRAARAARLALDLRRALPRAAIAVVAGRVEVRGDGARRSASDVARRGFALVRRDAEGKVRVDEGLGPTLGETFDVRRLDGRLTLVGERDGLAHASLPRRRPCVGREREIAMFTSTFREVASEPVARAIRVIGIAGIGKTRLVDEFLAKLREEETRCAVWMGRGDARRSSVPYGLIGPALRAALGIANDDSVEIAAAALRDRARVHFEDDDLARVVEFLRPIVGAASPDEEPSLRLALAMKQPMLYADHVRRAFVELVQAEARTRPLAIVIDDMELGDLASLDLIDAALSDAADLPLLVIGIARPDLEHRFPKLWAGRAVTDLKLTELTRRGSEKMVRLVLGDDAKEAQVERILARAGGNALFLEQLAEVAHDGSKDALPDTIAAVIESRIDAFSPERRRALRAASVFGTTFWRGGIAHLLSEGDQVELAATTEQLVERELVREAATSRFPGDVELAFRSALVRDTAYVMLPDADRRAGHLLAAEWLERVGDEPQIVAEHLERGGASNRASELYRRAATEAFARGEADLAEAAIERCIACASRAGTASVELLAELRVFEAKLHVARGNLGLAVSSATVALELASPTSPAHLAALAELGGVLTRTAESARLVELATDFRDTWPETAGDAEIIAAARMASGLLLAGERALAEDLLDRARARQVVASPVAMGELHEAAAMRALTNGDPARSLDHLRAAMTSAETLRDLRALARTRASLAYTLRSVGANAHASREAGDAMRAAEALQLGHVAALAARELGVALAQLGDLAEAEPHLLAARTALEAAGDVVELARTQCFLARLYERRGLLGEAQIEADAVARNAGLPSPIRVLGTAVRALVRIARGDTAGAFRDASTAYETWQASAGSGELEAIVKLALAEALFASDDEEMGAETAADAARALTVRASRLDAVMRAGFWAGVPEHARILVLARMSGGFGG